MLESVGSHQREADADEGGSAALTLAFVCLQGFSKSDVSSDLKAGPF